MDKKETKKEKKTTKKKAEKDELKKSDVATDEEVQNIINSIFN